MSNAEVITIPVAFHMGGHRCLKHFYLGHVCKHWGHLFPKTVSYNRFVKLEREAALPLLVFVKQVLLGKCTGVNFVDSTPMRVCRNQRILSHKVFKVIAYCRKAAAKEGARVRQSYARELKGLRLAQRFRGRSHSAKKVAKADRRMRTIAGRLVRELLRELPEESPYRERLVLCLKLVNGEKFDGHKIYSLHEPEVLCIGKGKEHKRYEFGNKVSVVRHWSGLIIGALSFRNEFDGHTVEKSLEQVGRVYGREVKVLAGDRGYRGVERSGDTTVVIPDAPKPTDSRHIREKKHRLFRKRAGIEPVIGHCKSDHRLGRNFYKGLFGDSINIMLAAAGFNFKRAIRLLFCPVLDIFGWIVNTLLIRVRTTREAELSPTMHLHAIPVTLARVFKG